MSEYWVPTKSGNKGPFSVDQLEQLVAAGRLPRAMDVIEVASELQIALDDLLPPPVEAVVDPAPVETAPAPKPAPAAPAAPRRAPSRGGSRGAPPRGGSRGRATGGARGGRPAARGGRGRAPAYVAKKSKAPLILGIVIVAIAGGGWFYWDWTNNASFLGKWYLDMDAMRRLVAEDTGKKYENMSEGEKLMVDGILTMFTDQFSFEFTDSKVILRAGDESMETPYKVLSRKGKIVVIETTEPDGSTDRGTLMVSRSKLTVADPTAPGGKFSLRR